jgi:pimeloyl-ACP methyl ester carboxylesterase
MTSKTSTDQTVSTWDDRIALRFKVIGSGPPLVYLHPAGGLVWDEFLDRLSESYEVYAPYLPGTAPGDSFAIHQIDDIFDVVLAYEGALRALGVLGAPVVGQSFGGMLAAELAAVFPSLFGRVVLLDPAGLWTKENPWTLDFMSAPPDQLPGLLFDDPDAEGVRAMCPIPASTDEAVASAVSSIWALGCAGKFLWPVPDRGLSKRLHRITAPTLIMWGENDRLIPVAYAHYYGERIINSTVQIVPNCGHVPQVERTDVTLASVLTFLSDGVAN